MTSYIDRPTRRGVYILVHHQDPETMSVASVCIPPPFMILHKYVRFFSITIPYAKIKVARNAFSPELIRAPITTLYSGSGCPARKEVDFG